MEPNKEADDEASTEDHEQQNNEHDSESCRMLRAEMAAAILGPALETCDSDWVQGLLHPRGPPPPTTATADRTTASSLGDPAPLLPEQAVPSNPAAALRVQNTQQHTPTRAPRGRSRSVPRDPVRRQRTSILGRSAAALEDSLRSQSNQLTMEQRLPAIEVAACLRNLLTRAGFSHENIAAGAEEARNSLIQSWATEDQQENGEEEIDPTGAHSASFSYFTSNHDINERKQRECQVQMKNWMSRHLSRVIPNAITKPPYHIVSAPLHSTPRYLPQKS